MQKRAAAWILLLPILTGLAACAGQPARPAQVEAASESTGVSISVESQPEGVAIAIHDPSGIGSAQFSHTGGEFPQQLTYQLYLKGLEQVQLTYGETQVTASLSSRPGHLVSQSVALEEGTPGGQALEPGGMYWMAIEIVPQDGAPPAFPLESGYIQVEPPPDFYQQQPDTWTLSWVDFYR